MSCKEKKKIVYSDGNIDKAIIGKITAEDDLFFTIESDNGREYKIGKKAVVLIKEVDNDRI